MSMRIGNEAFFLPRIGSRATPPCSGLLSPPPLPPKSSSRRSQIKSGNRVCPKVPIIIPSRPTQRQCDGKACRRISKCICEFSTSVELSCFQCFWSDGREALIEALDFGQGSIRGFSKSPIIFFLSKKGVMAPDFVSHRPQGSLPFLDGPWNSTPLRPFDRNEI